MTSYVHYVHKCRSIAAPFVSLMCRFVAILVYQGLIEEVGVFDEKEDAAGWLSVLAERFGADDCADSIIWDTNRKTPISIGFVTR